MSQIKNLDKRYDTQIKLVTKLMPYLQKNGLQAVRMDEIAKVMEISRATLYKYFSTKEEIVKFIVDGFVEYMNELSPLPLDSDQNFGIIFQQIFEQSVSHTIYFTDIFLKELESGYPDNYDQLSAAINQKQSKELTFYEEGIKKGIFNPVNGKLLLMQDEFLRGMLNAKYLLMNQMTVEQLLNDYYYLRKIQLFKVEKLSMIDDTNMVSKIDHLTQKITKTLF